jgi:hypothetical protein
MNKTDPYSYIHKLSKAISNKIMVDKRPVKANEKFYSFARDAMLSAPVTHVRNITGNLLVNAPVLGIENLKDIPASTIDFLTSKALGTERTTLFSPITKTKGQIKGFKQGLETVSRDFKVSRSNPDNIYKLLLREGMNPDTANEFTKMLSPKNKWDKITGRFQNIDTSKVTQNYELKTNRVFRNNVLNAIDSVIKTSLQYGDVIFYESAKEQRLAELKKINKTSEVSDEMLQDAELFALERVYQNDSTMRKRIANLRDALPLGKIVMPFTQTPANIIDKAFDYSGAGLIKGLIQMGSAYKNGKETFDQKAFVDRMGRTFSGFGLLTIGFLLAAKGLLTSSIEGSEKERYFRYGVGDQRYSLKFKIVAKEILYGLESLAPVGILMAMGAEIHDSYKENGLSTQVGIDALKTVGEMLISQSMLKGAMEYVSDFNITTTPLETLKEIPSQLTPNALKRLTYYLDPYVRETYDPSPIQEFINKQQRYIPFLSKKLPKKLTVMGEPIIRNAGFNGIFMVMFNPGYISKKEYTPEEKEIWDIFSQEKDTGVLPNLAKKDFRYNIEVNVNGKNVTLKGDMKLTADEYILYQRIMGKYASNMVKAHMSTQKYKSLDYEGKSKLLRGIMRDSMTLAREALVKRRLKLK